jgi:hypothetical protein
LNCIPSDIASFLHFVTCIPSFLLRHKSMVQSKRCRLSRELNEYVSTVWQERGFVKAFSDVSESCLQRHAQVILSPSTHLPAQPRLCPRPPTRVRSDVQTFAHSHNDSSTPVLHTYV